MLATETFPTGRWQEHRSASKTFLAPSAGWVQDHLCARNDSYLRRSTLVGQHCLGGSGPFQSKPFYDLYICFDLPVPICILEDDDNESRK